MLHPDHEDRYAADHRQRFRCLRAEHARTGDFFIHEPARGPPFGILPEHQDELLTPDFAHRGCCGWERFDSGVIGKGAVAGLGAAVAEDMWQQTATTRPSGLRSISAGGARGD